MTWINDEESRFCVAAYVAIEEQCTRTYKTGSIMVDLSAVAWESKYQTGQDRWDLGCPALPFIDLLKSAQAPKPGRIAVLGCGSGHDAMLFATAGFEVVGLDFAPSAIQLAHERAKNRQLSIQFLQRNIFELEPEFHGSFDYVLEHSCLCAIAPKLRLDYINVVHSLLKPIGQIIGLFYIQKHPSEMPPFGMTAQTLLDNFSLKFDAVSFKPAKKSLSRHKGKEYLGIFQKKLH